MYIYTIYILYLGTNLCLFWSKIQDLCIIEQGLKGLYVYILNIFEIQVEEYSFVKTLYVIYSHKNVKIKE